MVKVTIKPYNELIIHEVMEYKAEDLIKLHGLGQQAGALAPPLNWVDGVIFSFHGMPHITPIVREMLEGRLHWISVTFAIFPVYQNLIVIKETNVKIPIIDVSNNGVFKEVAIALKQLSKESKSDNN